MLESLQNYILNETCSRFRREFDAHSEERDNDDDFLNLVFVGEREQHFIFLECPSVAFKLFHITLSVAFASVNQASFMVGFLNPFCSETFVRMKPS